MDIERIITLGLSVYGAVLATILGARELIRERRRILIFLEYSEFSNSYSIIITNIGHRPITVLGVSMNIFQQNVQWEAVPQNVLMGADKPFPITLTDGQHFTFRLGDNLSEEIRDAKENISLVVYDSENRKYDKFKRLSYNEKFGLHK